jgi:hypothetical protein
MKGIDYTATVLAVVTVGLTLPFEEIPPWVRVLWALNGMTIAMSLALVFIVLRHGRARIHFASSATIARLSTQMMSAIILSTRDTRLAAQIAVIVVVLSIALSWGYGTKSTGT